MGWRDKLYDVYESIFCSERYRLKGEIMYTISKLEQLANPNRRPSRTDMSEAKIDSEFRKLTDRLRKIDPNSSKNISNYEKLYNNALREYHQRKR